MKFRYPIVMMMGAVIGLGPTLADADDIALSLVHPKGRVDIAVSALRRVDASPTFAFRNTETGEVHQYPNPHVEVCFTKDVSERICELTRQIIGEPLAIVVNCKTILKPIVREQLCTRPCLQISADDLAGANALAQQIRNGTNRLCAPSS